MIKDNAKGWFKCAGMRAIKTVAQALIAAIGTAVAMNQVDWKYTISTSVLAGIISLLMSIAGLPELKQNETTGDAEVVSKSGTEDITNKE